MFDRRRPGRLARPGSSRLHVEALDERILYSADLSPGVAFDADSLTTPPPLITSLDAGTEASITAATPSTDSVSQPSRDLIIVDARVENAESLVDQIRQDAPAGREFDILLIDADADAIDQINAYTEGHAPWDAWHVISHGSDGAIALGRETINAATLAERADDIGRWSGFIAQDGDLLLYGCDVASTADGRAFVDALSSLIDADVAASIDATGSATQGADFDLEYHQGDVQTAIALSQQIQLDFAGTLNTFVVTNTNNTGAGSLRQALADAQALAGADRIEFAIAGGGIKTITLASALPTITDDVVIDGRTQPGYAGTPLIQITTSAGNTHGFTFATSTPAESGVYGLSIYGFANGSISVSGDKNLTIESNYIGLNASGNAGATQLDGILINFAVDDIQIINNTIGGNQYGITGISSSGSVTIQSNYIGLNRNGAARANLTIGMYVSNSQAWLIGGVGANEGNTIANNGSGGAPNVGVDGNASRATILGNRMWNAGTIDINLWGTGDPASEITPNDTGDGDTGPNQLQNYPVLSTATVNASGTTIAGSLNSNASTRYRIEFFSAVPSQFNANGRGSSAQFLGYTTVTTDSGGNASFSHLLSSGHVNVGDRITATATVDNNNGTYGATSELAANVTATGATNFLVVDTTSAATDGNTSSIANLRSNRGADGRISLAEAITATNNTAGLDSIYFNIPDPLVNGVHRIAITTTLDGITSPVIINATTDPDFAGAPVVQLDGSALSVANPNAGLRLFAGANGSTIRGLAIDGFGDAGIQVWVTSGNTIAGNEIGLNASGLASRTNQGPGITIGGGSNNNVIGGTSALDRNVLTLNQYQGLYIGQASGTLVQGNYVGLNRAGNAILDNGNVGIGVDSQASNTTIGGTTVGARNVVTVATGVGILINGATGATIQGNYVGTDATGMIDLSGAALLSGNSGIVLNTGTTNALVGGTTAGAGNLVSGYGWYGIELLGAGTSNNTIQGNYIGLNSAGTGTLANRDGGISLYNGPTNNLIGGDSAAARNYVIGSGGNLIVLTGSGTAENRIQGNYLGVYPSGIRSGVSTAGFTFQTGAHDNLVGGTTANSGNRIDANGSNAMWIASSAGTGNSFLGNQIQNNLSLAIDIAPVSGPTPNDANDSDTGPNDLQNYPVIASAGTDGASTVITGSLNSESSTTYRLEFFQPSGSGSGSGYGPGDVYLGSTTVTTDGSGNANFNITLGVATTVGGVVTATATEVSNPAQVGIDDRQAYGSTSEFAANVTVSNADPYIDLDGDNSSGAGGDGAYQTSHTEGGGAVLITDSDYILTDVTSANLTMLTVAISNRLDGTAEVLAANTTGTSITASYDSGTGFLTLSGIDTVAKYRQVLGTVTYSNNAQAPNTTTRQLFVLASDGTNSSNTAVASVSIVAVNDAPVLAGSNSMTAIDEDNQTSSGTLVSALISGQASDVDSSPVGMAIAGVNSANGTLEYSTDGGTNWTPVGTVSDSASLLLNGDALTRLRFLPAANFNGSATPVTTFRAWDGSSGSAGSKVSTTVNGGSSAFSSATSSFTVAVNPINDAPVATGSANLPDINEDTTSSAGQTVVTLFAGNFSNSADSSNPSQNQLAGVAVRAHTNTPAQGTWQYSINAGSSWVNLGTVSDASALTLRTSDLLRFVPAANYNGSPTGLSVRLIDNSTTVSGAASVDVSTNGGVTPYSSATVAVQVTVLAVDDVPTVANNNTLSLAEGATATIGNALLQLQDVDTAASGLTYTLTSTPTRGSLRLNGSPLATNATFTQADINGGLLSYAHNGTENLSDSFGFTYADGSSGALGGPELFSISVTPVNDNAPIISSNGGGGSASTSVAENNTAVTTVTATDADMPGDTFTYSIIGGVDAAGFSIGAGGALTFNTAPNFESPTDSGTNNVYDVQVQVSDGVNTDTQTLAITVTNVNESSVSAVSDSDAAANAVVENAANGTVVGIDALATDTDTSDTITYSLADASGTLDDAGGRFTINSSSGIVTVANGTLLDREAAASHDITVRADSSDGSFSVQSFTIALTPVNDHSPAITSSGGGATASTSVAENSTAVTTVTATDADLPGETLTYSIIGGADSALFSIDAGGALTFNTAPNFEAPADTGTNNVYDVQVQVSDGTNTDTQALAITVTNVNEGAVSAVSDSDASADQVAENAANGTVVGIDALATDTDTSDTITYSLADASGTPHDAGGRFTINTSTGVVRVANGTLLDREAAASHGITIRADSSDGSFSVQTFTISLTPVNDNLPVITSNGGGATGSASVAENSTAVTTVIATDADLPGDALTYSIIGGADSALLSIGAGGALTFNTAPNFESPTDSGTNNVYDVQVQVSDGANTDTQALAITITNVNEGAVSAVSDSDAAANAVAENAANGTVVGIDALATDPDTSDTITYSLTDASSVVTDAGGRFTINTSTGVVTVANGTLLDREAAASHDITVRADSSDGSFSVQSFTIALTPVNDHSPVITSNGAGATASTSVAENSTAVTTVTATDADLPGETLTYSIIGGADAAVFSIDAGGALTFSAAPNFEVPADAGNNNVYDVQVQVSDGTNTDTQALAITITNVNEGAVSAVSDSDAAANAVAENAANGTVVGIDALATDPDTSDTITYSLTDASSVVTDAGGRFTINTSTGVVTVANGTLLDREAAASHGITVRADSSDGSFSVQSFTIALTPVNDHSPAITSNGGGATGSTSVAENSTAVTTVTATDADLPGETLTYSIIGGADSAVFSIDAGGALTFNAAPNFEAPADVGTNNVYDVQVQVSDGVNTDTQALAITVTNVNESAVSAVSDSDAAANSVAENAANGTVVGIDALATDTDTSDTITYSLADASGTPDDAGGRFTINTSTGVVTVANGTLLDREAAASHGITIRADCSDGSFSVQTFTIALTPVNDHSPAITSNGAGATASTSVAENSTAVTTVTATDADLPGETLTYSIIGGADSAVFSIDAGGALTFSAAPNFEVPADAGDNNVYDVQVQVSDGTNTDTQALAITITNVNEGAVSAVSDSDAAANAVAENAANGTVVGIDALATDPDTSDTITYSLTDASSVVTDAGGRFTINTSTGVVTVANGSLLDREAAASHDITVRADSSDGSFSVQTFTIALTPVNDHSPAITSNGAGATASTSVAENSTAVTTVIATDADLPGETLTYSIIGGTDSALFSIDAGGALTFSAAPNFEAPADVGNNNVYDVQVQVSDGVNADTQALAITVTNVNESAVSAVSDSDAAANAVAENATNGTVVGIDALATDSDTSDTITYSLADASGTPDDAGGRFTINTSTGVVTVANGTLLDREAAASHGITIRADSSDGSFSVQTFTIALTPVNDHLPVITSNGGGATGSASVAENSTAVTTVIATDADLPGDALTYSIIGGDDAALFSIDAGGALTFNAAPNFEAPADDGNNNVYDVQVQVSDGTNTDTQALAITVTNVNEGAVSAVSDSDAAANAVIENAANGTVVGIDALATDPDTSDTITYSLADASSVVTDAGGRFTINTSTGVVTVANGTLLDREAAASHDITVRADSSDGSFSVQTFTIALTPVNDHSPAITSNGAGATASTSVAENSTAVTTVTATDADLPGETLTYSIIGGADSAVFSIDAGGALTFSAAPNFEVPADAGNNNVYDVQVQVSDGANTDTQALAITVTNVNESAVSAVSDSDAAANSVAENAANGTVVGIDALATDPDTSDTITYSLTDASSVVTDAGGRFTINTSTGVVTVANGTLLDREAAASHGITVRADSSDGSFSVQSFTIALTPVNDHSPAITSNGAGATASTSVAENSTAVTTVTATDADLPGETLTYSIIGGADSAVFSIDAGGALTFNTAPNFEAPADAGTDNVYDVLVQVSDGVNTDTQTLAITITNVNESAVSAVSDSDAAANAVIENAANGTVVGIDALATDTDTSDTITYSLTDASSVVTDAGGRFTINTSTGVVTVANGTLLDREAAASHDITVRADSSDGSFSVQTFTIALTPVNDHSPAITSNGAGATASTSVAENSTAVTTVTATDADLPGETLTYSIIGGADSAVFSIDAGGALTFNSAPNFEVPADTGTNNVYDVQVQVSDGTNTDTQALAITVTNVNESAVSAVSDSDAAANSVAENAANGTVVGIDALATDTDTSDTITYSLADASGTPDDAGGRFTINTSTGVVTVANGTLLDREAAASHGITVRADSSDGSFSVQSFTIALTPVNDHSPAITSNGAGATASTSVAENSTAVTTVTATDADLPGETLTYSIIGGADSAVFSIDAGGALTFNTAPNFEAPADAGTDNVYDVLVQVSDGVNTDTQTLAITITNVNESAVSAVSDSDAAANAVVENAANGTVVGIDALATDPDTSDTITYSLADASGTPDDAGGRFTINTSTGVVTVANGTLLDREAAASHGITIRADSSDGSFSVQTFTISLTPVNDHLPVITSNGAGATASTSVAENSTAVTTVTATDADLPGETLTYSIIGGADSAVFSIDAGGALTFNTAPNFEAPADAGTDNVYDVLVQVSDGVNTDTQALAITVTNVNEGAVSAVSDSDAAANAVIENAANGTVVGIDALATDTDTSDTITYSLTDASSVVTDAGGRFTINTSTGVVTVANGTLLDREAAASHDITVRADSSDGSFSVQTFTIALTPVNDHSPAITSNGAGATASTSVAENSTAVTTVTATDADLPGETLTYSIIGGADSAVFSIDAGGALTFSTAPNFEVPADTGTNNVYDVQVQVSDGTNTDTQALAITVTNVNEGAVSAVSDSDASADQVAENAANGTVVGIDALATDPDTSDTITYSLADASGTPDDAGGRFTINTSTGVVTVANGTLLDREAAASHGITIRADSSDGSFSVQTFTISLTPVNDHLPVITSNGAGATASTSVAENSTAVTTVTATDADLPGETLTYSIIGGADSAVFSIDAGGALTFNTAPNFEAPADAGTDNVYDVLVQVSDGVNTDTQALAITVTNVNEGAVSAVSDSDAAANAVIENAANGTVVGIDALATDPDTSDTITYSLTDASSVVTDAGGRFTINTSTGVVTVANGTLLDREAAASHDITVRADSSDGSFSVQTFTIALTPVNDHSPAITSNGAGATASTSVAENSTAVTTVTATDADLPGETLTYSIIGGADSAVFSIDAGGALTFSTAPNFEVPADTGTNNVYDVQVQVSDGTNTDTQALAITVTNVNEGAVSAVSDSDASADQVAENAANGTVVGIDALATDPDTSDTITYSLADASGTPDDAGGRFTINTSTGVVTVANGTLLDREAAASHGITVRADSSDGSFSVQTFTIALTPVNDHLPVITSNGAGATASTSVAENSTAVTTVTATDADLPGETLTYSISGGDDAALFSIDAGGALTFNSAPNFEAPADDGTNNVYDVLVQVSDGANTDTQTLAITITNVNEGAVSAVSDSDAAANAVVENAANGTVVGIDALATDTDTSDTITYSLADASGTPDDAGGRFTINSSSGIVTVANGTLLDREAAASHDITVRADSSDGSFSVQSFTIALTPVNDHSPAITSNGAGATASTSVAENSTAVTTVTATDADLPGETLTYSIIGGADSAVFSIDAGGALTFNTAPNFEAPADAGTDNVYDVLVQVSDGVNTDTQTLAITITNVNESAVSAVSDSDAAANAVVENAANGTVVGIDALATDPDTSDTITYSLADASGTPDDAGGRFTINTSTGVVTVANGTLLDREAAASHDITVRADSSDGSFSVQTFTIALTPVNDHSPAISSNGAGDTASTSVAENSTTVTTVTVTDADLPGDTLTYSIIGGTDSALFSIDAGGALTFNAAPNFEAPADADTDNVYDVQVQVSDGTNTDSQALAITVTNVNESAVSAVSDSDASADQVAENAANGTVVGIDALATDPDTSDTITYSLADASGTPDDAGGRFTINTSTGVVTVANGTLLDRETAASHDVTVRS